MVISLLAQVDASHVGAIWCLPFAIMLASIAIAPFINKHWWEKNYPYVSLALAAVGMVYYMAVRRDMGPWLHEVEEYVGFIALLGSLYVVSGGIVVHVLRKATPRVNVVLLLLGAVLANFFGTTGASMLLIRPFMRINRGHLKPYHVVFFIFVVSNAGGCLTPIGDPPLFLGYLRGVPFWWVMEHCWPMWATAVCTLVAIFFVIDTRDHAKTERQHPSDPGPAVQVLGLQNMLFMFVIIGAVFRESAFEAARELSHGFSATHLLALVTSREVLMIAAAVTGRVFTSKLIYQRNEFTFGPIIEVAILFIGIFSTMVPVLEYLEHHAERLPIRTPAHYYFASGVLSSVLDNAPTYATFLQTRLGIIDPEDLKDARAEAGSMAAVQSLDIRPGLKPPVHHALEAMVKYHSSDLLKGEVSESELGVAFLLGNPALNLFLVALSCGAVFFGACTYIGNGPNFMVKSVADGAGVKMPGFFGYVFRYALPVLVPTYVLIWLIFF